MYKSLTQLRAETRKIMEDKVDAWHTSMTGEPYFKKRVDIRDMFTGMKREEKMQKIADNVLREKQAEIAAASVIPGSRNFAPPFTPGAPAQESAAEKTRSAMVKKGDRLQDLYRARCGYEPVNK